MNFDESGKMYLIESEGDILSVVRSTENQQYYIKANCLENKARIYARTNDIIIEMFIEGRLTVKELFMIRADEGYLINFGEGYDKLHIEESKESEIMNSIQYSDSKYHSIPKELRNEDAYEKIVKYLRDNFGNGDQNMIDNSKVILEKLKLN